MQQLLLDIQSVLASADYRVAFPSQDSASMYFEDESLLGAVFVMDSVDALLDGWEHTQDTFLRRHGSAFSSDPFKAWNCYTVFLTSESRGSVDRSRLIAIEEDFRGSRKLVGTGVASKPDIERALAPLLSLRHLRMSAKGSLHASVSERLGSPDGPLQDILRDVDIEVIASLLLESQ